MFHCGVINKLDKCNYYVMQWMSTIVYARKTSS